ncbi:MAG: formyltransferase family protein, partial [Gammaproteobacteria bacterium]
GIAVWLANTLDLVGIVKLRESRQRLFSKLRREGRRVGLFRMLDVIAFRIYYHLWLVRRDSSWIRRELAHLQAEYPADLDDIPTLVTEDPNAKAVRHFLKNLKTDLLIARCKFILKPEIFNVPKHGTYVLHPGICPEYRNAHGCFWALANRDLKRVGMTLLRADQGVDTGPILMQASCDFDETRESHIVIQYRVVLDNLTKITEKLLSAWCGEARPLPIGQRQSAVWGQPWLTSYLRWKYQARRTTK